MTNCLYSDLYLLFNCTCQSHKSSSTFNVQERQTQEAILTLNLNRTLVYVQKQKLGRQVGRPTSLFQACLGYILPAWQKMKQKKNSSSSGTRHIRRTTGIFFFSQKALHLKDKMSVSPNGCRSQFCIHKRQKEKMFFFLTPSPVSNGQKG